MLYYFDVCVFRRILMIINATAYPRAALIGNPSDGYFGKTIAFVFNNYRASVQLYETPELTILPAVRDTNVFADLETLCSEVGKRGYYGGIRLMKATARQFYLCCIKKGISLPRRNFTIRYDSDIPNRLGLAGSSAIITAALRAICQFYEVSFPLPEFANMVLAVERDELSIPAGLQDRVAQTYNHPVYMDFERNHMEKYNYGIYEAVDIPDDLNLFVAYRTDLAEGSEILHSRLRDDYNSGVPRVLDAMQEWSELTVKMKEALQKHDHAKIPSLINRNFDLRYEVCAGSISEKNLQMVQLARKMGASAKFTGSGGAIIGSYDDENMFAELRNELKKFQIEVIKPQIVREMVQA